MSSSLSPPSDVPTRQGLYAIVDYLHRGCTLPEAIDRSVQRFSNSDVHRPIRRALERMQDKVKKNPSSVLTREEARSLCQANDSARIRYSKQNSGRIPSTVAGKTINAAGQLSSVLCCSYGEAEQVLRALGSIPE